MWRRPGRVSTIGSRSGNPATTLGVVTNGLQLYLNAADPASYPGSGTTWTDLSTNAYSTTLVGAPAFNTTYFTFDGTTEYVDTNQSLASATFSIGAWFRTTAAGINMILSKESTTGNPWNYRLWINSGSIVADISQAPATQASLTSPLSSYNDGDWYYAMFTRDDSNWYLYVNGLQIATRADPYTGSVTNSQELWVGRSAFTNGGASPTGMYQYTGDLGAVFIYNRALSAEEIAQNYTATRSTWQNLTVQTFTTAETTTWTAPVGTTSVDYLVVGGGGGAGNGYDNAGGGGGGAGMVLTGTASVTPGQSYTVTVGSGGAGGADARTNNPGTAGENSVFAAITALGGGPGLGSRTGGTAGAAQISNTAAPTGGSGSGGGSGGKGGGGAGGAGSANSSATGGAGGTGTASSITGSSVTYGVGGAGGSAGAPTTDGANGTANRGNGGAGGRSNSSDSAKGGDGGSGIVVLKYYQAA